MVDGSLSMPGGGNMRLGVGQITDDSEHAMCLLHGLIEGKGKLVLSPILRYFGMWM